MQTEIRVDRLLHLIEILKKVEAENKLFDMRNWIQKNECGTACCAMGYAALDPEFQKQGLFMSGMGYLSTAEYILTINQFNSRHYSSMEPIFRYNYEDKKANEFFGINMSQYFGLILPVRYSGCNDVGEEDIKPYHVIARIQELIDFANNPDPNKEWVDYNFHVMESENAVSP